MDIIAGKVIWHVRLQAQPAKFIIAAGACHVIASIVFENSRTALRTKFYKEFTCNSVVLSIDGFFTGDSFMPGIRAEVAHSLTAFIADEFRVVRRTFNCLIAVWCYALSNIRVFEEFLFRFKFDVPLVLIVILEDQVDCFVWEDLFAFFLRTCDWNYISTVYLGSYVGFKAIWAEIMRAS